MAGIARRPITRVPSRPLNIPPRPRPGVRGGRTIQRRITTPKPRALPVSGRSFVTIGTRLLSRFLGVAGLVLTPTELADATRPQSKLISHAARPVRSITEVKPPEGRQGTLSPYERAAGWYKVVVEDKGRAHALIMPRSVLVNRLATSKENLDRVLNDVGPDIGPKPIWRRDRRPRKAVPPVEVPHPTPKPVGRPAPRPVAPRPKPVAKPAKPGARPAPKAPVKPVRPIVPRPVPEPPPVAEVPEPGLWGLPGRPNPWVRPDWETLPELSPSGAWFWPEVVVEGRIRPDGAPEVRVRTRLAPDALPRRGRDEKPRRRGLVFALHQFVTHAWGSYSELQDLYEVLVSNLYTDQHTRVSLVDADPQMVLKEWIAGRLHLDVEGFTEDWVINQMEDAVIGRMSRAISEGTMRFMGDDPYTLSINQRLNALRRTVAQIGSM